MVNRKLLLDSIEKEKRGTEYCYGKNDKELLKLLFNDINNTLGTNISYLAEVDAFVIPNSGPIIARYIKKFESESVRGYLIPKIAHDKVEDCDTIILDSYLHFKRSNEYIPDQGKPAPAHIYVRYDNAFARIKPRTIKKELLQLARNPRDAFYLPLTVRMLSSWKTPELENVLFSYIDGNNITHAELGLPEQSDNYYPSVNSIRRELKINSLLNLKYYNSERAIDLVVKHSNDTDKDIRLAAKKVLKYIHSHYID